MNHKPTILAVEDVEGYLPINESQCRGRELFALRVVGESMINAGILDGDYVVAHKTPVAENGDIVVALLEDEATVKRSSGKTDIFAFSRKTLPSSPSSPNRW